ncbi:hypothetical protein SKAU_G00247490 [Synaphobranchus kaupii]|uniref:Uncharacterized protein n=1 Tax=Synaphobranchus kaupii TaxID=118154 RepID=A0A9Q1F265_SYNKA|nr:hypothetical protein SKAU_G00247490 [Synaphobranchus kaupii]
MEGSGVIVARVTLEWNVLTGPLAPVYYRRPESAKLPFTPCGSRGYASTATICRRSTAEKSLTNPEGSSWGSKVRSRHSLHTGTNLGVPQTPRLLPSPPPKILSHQAPSSTQDTKGHLISPMVFPIFSPPLHGTALNMLTSPKASPSVPGSESWAVLPGGAGQSSLAVSGVRRVSMRTVTRRDALARRCRGERGVPCYPDPSAQAENTGDGGIRLHHRGATRRDADAPYF